MGTHPLTKVWYFPWVIVCVNVCPTRAQLIVFAFLPGFLLMTDDILEHNLLTLGVNTVVFKKNNYITLTLTAILTLTSSIATRSLCTVRRCRPMGVSGTWDAFRSSTSWLSETGSSEFWRKLAGTSRGCVYWSKPQPSVTPLDHQHPRSFPLIIPSPPTPPR